MQELLITGHQMRAARGALNWSVQRLADETGLGTATIVRYEQSEGVPRSRKDGVELIKSALETAGIEFVGTPDDGPGIRIHSGRQST